VAASETGASARNSDEFVITRTFDAPRDLVFRAWTEREHLMRWWGPKGFTMRAGKIDLRPGGVFHYGMRAPDGSDMWGKWIFRDVVKPERLVFIVSFSDEQGGQTRHPMAPDWPLETLSTVTFAEQDGKTAVTIRWAPHAASEAERKTFAAGRDSMQQGWTGTFDQFAAYLAKTER
jgi:uncharacterized protein YndB with AHSA1/START domain